MAGSPQENIVLETPEVDQIVIIECEFIAIDGLFRDNKFGVDFRMMLFDIFEKPITIVSSINTAFRDKPKFVFFFE